jgi:hypothetical protein
VSAAGRFLDVLGALFRESKESDVSGHRVSFVGMFGSSYSSRLIYATQAYP